jgi:signal transduction histidine kinase
MARYLLPNLRTRLVAVIFLALLPAFVLLVTVAELERTRALENARLESTAMAQLLKLQFAELESTTEQMLAGLALLPEVQDPYSPACSERIERFFSTQGNLMGLSVAALDGDAPCLASRAPLTGTFNIADRPYFQGVLASQQFTVGGFVVGRTTGKPNLTFGYPVLDEQGNLKAVITAGVDLEGFNQRLAGAQLYQHTALLVLDAGGTVVLRQPDPENFLGHSMADEPLAQHVMQQREGTTRQTGLDGVERLYAFTTIGAGDAPRFHVLVGFDSVYIFAGVNRMLRSTLLGLTVIGLVALVAAWLSAEVMIVRRAQHVVNAALRMRAGDLSARAGLEDDRSEVGQLAHTFDSMAAALQEREAENRRLIEETQQLNAELEFRVAKRTEQLQISNNRLLDSQAELRRLSEQLMRVAEQERIRISREIHDQLGQLLTGVKMELRGIDRALSDATSQDNGSGAGARLLSETPQIRDRLTETTTLVDETIRTVRRIAADLRPGLLDDFGLTAAVEWQMQEFENRTGIRCTLESDVVEEQLSRDMATAAFRICQEALTNVARHAEATAVHISLATADGRFSLTVRDNGRGIDPEALRRSRSLGVLGMRERARQFNGTIHITPVDVAEDEKGTELRLELPLEEGN